jgi:hypothetical protein
MYVFPIAVIEKVARESRSGFPNAPVVPYEPPRRLPRLRRRLARRSARPVCQAEIRDRSPKVAGAARTC